MGTELHFISANFGKYDTSSIGSYMSIGGFEALRKAVTMDGEDYEKVDFRGGVALVIGAEGEGISRLTLETCDQKVSLPMAGHLDSLNASVAAGVMMYRVLASRRA